MFHVPGTTRECSVLTVPDGKTGSSAAGEDVQGCLWRLSLVRCDKAPLFWPMSAPVSM